MDDSFLSLKPQNLILPPTFSFQKKVRTDILEICKPILNLFDITFFSHARAFHNGQFASLMTNPELTEYYLEQKYLMRFSQGNGIFLNAGCYIANYMPGDSRTTHMLNELRVRFNVAHPIYVIDKHAEYDDMYVFASSPENTQFINQYINNMDIFKHFILYYKDKSVSIIKKADLVRYSSEHFVSADKRFDYAPIFSNTNNREKYLEKMTLKKIQMLGKSGDVYISAREFECLKYIVKNYTLKEIAKVLSLSPRTVETYVNNLKHKLGCEKTNQLIEIFERNSLF